LMRSEFRLRNLVATVLDVIEDSLCGGLGIERGARGCFGSTQGVACLYGLHFAKTWCLGITSCNTCCGGSGPAVRRCLSIVWRVLLDNRNPLAILVLCKATIDFLLP